MYLLKEINTSEINTVIEEDVQVAGGKKYYIEGIMMQANKKNKNGRIYPREVMEKEVNRYIRECVEVKSAFGELDHPESPSVNMTLVSHIVESLRFDGDNIVGRAKIIDTPNGRIVKTLIDEGARFGVSSRALGNLTRTKDALIVQPDLKIMAIDIVGEPSAPDAFMTGLVEGKQWVWENGRVKEKQLEEMKEQVLNTPKRTPR